MNNVDIVYLWRKINNYRLIEVKIRYDYTTQPKEIKSDSNTHVVYWGFHMRYKHYIVIYFNSNKKIILNV